MVMYCPQIHLQSHETEGTENEIAVKINLNIMRPPTFSPCCVEMIESEGRKKKNKHKNQSCVTVCIPFTRTYIIISIVDLGRV